MTNSPSDRRSNWSEVLFIVAFIGFVIDGVYQGGFIHTDPVGGFVRVKLKEPGDLNSLPPEIQNNSSLPGFVRESLSNLTSYSTGSSIFIPTRIVIEKDSDAKSKEERVVEEYYTDNIGNYSLKVNAQLLFPGIQTGKHGAPISYALEELFTTVKNSNLEKRGEYGPQRKAHQVSIENFLNIEGITLQNKSDTKTCREDRCTFRDEGAVFSVNLYCKNTDEYLESYKLFNLTEGIVQSFKNMVNHIQKPSCEYRVFRLPQAEYKREFYYSIGDGPELKRKEHGILVEFKIEDGFVGHMSGRSAIGTFIKAYGTMKLIFAIYSLSLKITRKITMTSDPKFNYFFLGFIAALIAIYYTLFY